jgi:hypothetical protein
MINNLYIDLNVVLRFSRQILDFIERAKAIGEYVN